MDVNVLVSEHTDILINQLDLRRRHVLRSKGKHQRGNRVIAAICILFNYHGRSGIIDIENLTVDWLAATVGLSPKYLSRVFAKARGVSMIEYLTDVRINNACGLLLGTNNLISDIAERVGYKDALYFTKVFKKYMGVSPTVYRATQKQ